jgi:predicted DNA-binding ArsR family transcriptional regulator
MKNSNKINDLLNELNDLIITSVYHIEQAKDYNQAIYHVICDIKNSLNIDDINGNIPKDPLVIVDINKELTNIINSIRKLKLQPKTKE